MRGRLESPFVGREQELAMLELCLAEARSTEPRVVVLDGEPGIGKSTLLSRFIASVPGAAMLRATGDEAESRVSYGVVEQLLADAEDDSRKGRRAAREISGDHEDPVASSTDLVEAFQRVRRGREVVVVAIDDLHWTDQPSAVALRLALRRARQIPLLALFALRSEQSLRLGEDWARFVSGDHRVVRLRIGGLGRRDVVALAEALGAGRLTPWSAARLLEHTGGNPLHCSALLEELDPDVWTRPGRLPAPRALAALVLARVGKLSVDTQRLVSGAAALGRRCRLDVAAAIAGLTDPLAALQEAVKAGLLAEIGEGPAAQISFTHALIQRAVYDDLGPARRREIHRSAVELVEPLEALSHRVAAAYGPDRALASDLDAAAVSARREGRFAEAASWWSHAAAASATLSERNRRATAGLELLVRSGNVAEAEALLATSSELPRDPRLNSLAGELDLLAGRFDAGMRRLHAAWLAHDDEQESSLGARVALLLAHGGMLESRLDEAAEWAERAAVAARGDPPLQREATAFAGVILVMAGREADGARRLASVAPLAGHVAAGESELLLWRGAASFLTDDLGGATADLSAAAGRLRASGNSRSLTECLCWLAGCEYLRGEWDDCALHAELAVQLAQDAARVWDLCFAHAQAARVSAGRGDWAAATTHVNASGEAAATLGVTVASSVAAWAAACLAWARGRFEEFLPSAAPAGARGQCALLGQRSTVEWHALEIDALISLGRVQHASDALTALERIGNSHERPFERVTLARLRGKLAGAKGDPACAEMAFRQAWNAAERLEMPLEVARLGLDDGRRLRQAGRRSDAAERLRSARERLEKLRATPYVELCDHELAACGFDARAEFIPAALGLTPSELIVAGLVAKGRSNREVAAELFLSIKTVEFHLRHIFAKLQIHRRRELADLIGG
jgi:DNA-binding CsgD family transcriptional regulator